MDRLAIFKDAKNRIYFGILLFILSSLACISFDSIYTFIFFRFLEALGGCAGVVIARAIVNDNFELKEAASVFALMMVISSLVPMLSPGLGSILLDYFSWKSIFAVLFGLGIFLLLLIFLGLNNIKENTASLKFNSKENFNNYIKILKDRRFKIYVFSSSFAMATIFAYITGSSYVFIDYYGLSEKSYGILFGINAANFMIFANINARIVRRYSPYYVLPFSFTTMFGIALLLTIAGFFDLGFLVFEILLFFMIGMLGFIIPNTTTLAMARFKENSGSASAILGAIQFTLAGGISFVVSYLEANSPLPLALIITICLIIACRIYFLLNAKRIKQYKRQWGLK